jgi:hypothetical protein
MQGRFKMEYRLLTIVRYNYRDYNTPSKPNMHARLKTMQKETSTRTKRTSGRQQDSKNILKTWRQATDGREEIWEKVKSSKSKGENYARTRRGLKPTSGGGAGVVRCVGFPVWRWGRRAGGSEGLLEASHAGKGARKGKTNCGWVRGRLR